MSSAGCVAAVGETDDIDTLDSALTRSQREERMRRIRDVAVERGFGNYWLLSAIAKCETELAHCWSEATWACQGPSSDDCGGGPVIAGSGDGACSRRRGGLGLFQFDAGNYDDTLRREGDVILTLDGNIDAAVSYVTNAIIGSRYVPGVSSEADAFAWADSVRVGDPSYDAWLRTVTGYYNGCFEGACSAYASRRARYDRCHRDLIAEHGEAFFFGDSPADDPSDPPPSDPPPSDPPPSDPPPSEPPPSDPPPSDPTPACGDASCATGESCASCPADCGACDVPACSVPGHATTAEGGGSCTVDEAWRCVYSESFGTNTSQVCRDGRWINFHLSPRDCRNCCGSYSIACRQSGA